MTEQARDAESGGERLRQELHTSELAVGDVLVIETDSGSNYKIEVTDVEGLPKGVLSRHSNHELRGEPDTWEMVSEDTLFELRGSCKRVLKFSTGYAPGGEERDVLRVGKRAWLGTKLEGEDKTLITTNVKSITVGV